MIGRTRIILGLFNSELQGFQLVARSSVARRTGASRDEMDADTAGERPGVLQ